MKIRILSVDDWNGLYIDGKLVMENHELVLEDVISMVAPDADFKVVYTDELETGHCPEKWSDELEEFAEINK